MISFNSKKFDKLGIRIDENQKPPEAYIPADLSDCTKHDLWLAFSGNINFKIDENQSTKNLTPNSQRDTVRYSLRLMNIFRKLISLNLLKLLCQQTMKMMRQ